MGLIDRLSVLVTGLGMTIWTLAAVGSGVSQGFWTLMIARICVGAGRFFFNFCRPTQSHSI